VVDSALADGLRLQGVGVGYGYFFAGVDGARGVGVVG
jgi:hypothetical protein